MQVNKTKAAELAGISRRTFYNHIPQKRISICKDEADNEVVDVSELERVYGKELIQRNLKLAEDAQDDMSNGAQSTHSFTPSSVKYEVLILQEKVVSLEALNRQMGNSYERERDQNDELLERLKKAQEVQSQLLTDQREGKSEQASVQEKKLADLEQTVAELKKHNIRVLRELKSEKSKSLWQRLFG